MTTARETGASAPTLTDQVTRLYDIIGGYHATHLLEIAQKLGVWRAVTERPGVTSAQLAAGLGTEPFYTDVLCRTAFSFGLLDRQGEGWRMAPHMDQILGNPESPFYLADAARVHLKVGEDYAEYVRHFKAGTRKPYQAHGEDFMEDVAAALKSLPRIFIEAVLPRLPALQAKLEAGAEVLDVGCGGGWALVQFAQTFPAVRCTGIDIEPYSIEMARKLIAERGLQERCRAALGDIRELVEPGAFDVATSFLVVHEIDPGLKAGVFEAVARGLRPGGSFLIFDEAYPEDDSDLRSMPKRFAALAQWFELIWGNRVNTRGELHELCESAGLEVTEETGFSRFHILVATKSE